MYHALWANWYFPAAQPALEKLFFPRIPRRSRVLDLCCGSGHVTQELVRLGYEVTGIDSSADLIEEGRKVLPGVDLRVLDARYLMFDREYDAALSTFDSLNHILTIEELCQVFLGVRKSLYAGGLFVFDMNLEQAYFADLRQWSVTIQERNVSLVRGTYDAATKLASTELIWFLKQETGDLWEQRRSIVEQRCYSQAEILLALEKAGFQSLEATPARDAGVTSELGFGRVFYAARAGSIYECGKTRTSIPSAA
jgi:SAM-dependent methyltransferase